MKISHLISMLEAVQKSRGDLEIPFQICYEKLFENGELNAPHFLCNYGV